MPESAGTVLLINFLGPGLGLPMRRSHDICFAVGIFRLGFFGACFDRFLFAGNKDGIEG